MCSGGYAGSGRALRLDPCGLPVRFSASDAAADGRVRDVELHRERVVVRRSLHGMRMALNMPVAAFAGISLRLEIGRRRRRARGCARAHRSVAYTATVSHVGSRRSCGRMARVERGAGRAAAARRARRGRGQCPSRTNSDRAPTPAPPPQKRAQRPAALDPAAAWNRQFKKEVGDPPRRTRDHRAELGS